MRNPDFMAKLAKLLADGADSCLSYDHTRNKTLETGPSLKPRPDHESDPSLWP